MAEPDEPELPPIVSDERKTARKRVILGAKIVYNEGAYTLDCRIRDMSDGGARIVLGPGLVIPKHVNLIDPRNAIAYECEVMWIKAPEFGLKFMATHSLRGELPVHLRYLKRFA